MRITKLLAVLLTMLLTFAACGKREQVPMYATKLPAPSTTDENHPINRYNDAIAFNKPICVSVNIQGST